MPTRYIFRDNVLVGYSDSPYSEGEVISDPLPDFNPLLQRCKRVNNQWVLETIDNTEHCKRLLRRERNRLLLETDWRDLPSYQGTDQNEWRSYRQALRDLPSTASPTLVNGVLLNVTWPTKPD